MKNDYKGFLVYEELLKEVRKLTVRDIKIALNQRGAMHAWAVAAYEKALEEKIGAINNY